MKPGVFSGRSVARRVLSCGGSGVLSTRPRFESVMITYPVNTQLNCPVGGHPRSSGIHLSRVLRNIAVESTSHILDPKWVTDFSLEEVGGQSPEWWDSLDWASKIRISIGLAWEDWYVPQLGTVAYHPGEMEVEGVYMTHDGESVDVLWGGDLALHEVKTTAKSTKTVGNLTTQWLWLEQLKGYCKGLGVRTAFMHVLFLHGDYKYPITPQLKCWRVEFTQAEIDEHWELITDYIKYRQQQERADRDDDGVE